jgi:transcriptional regulator with XRE-family HTH domain
MSSDSSDPKEWRLLGARLKNAREYLNFSQQLVSDRTGIPRTAVSDIERGERRVDSLELRKLARLYRFPIAYFLDEEPDADASEHAVSLLARRLTTLIEEDRNQVLEFAKYLEFRRRADREAETAAANSVDATDESDGR